jgi:hypothetical protein
VVSGTSTQITVTPDGGNVVDVGGTCGGTLEGTTYTTDPLTQDCTVLAAFSVDGGSDLIPPTLDSADINAAGTTLTAIFSEPVVLNGAIPTVTSDVAPVTLASPSGGSSDTQTWAASRTIAVGESIFLSYVQPGDGIEDLAGNDLASVSNVAVANGSTYAGLTSFVLSPPNGTFLRKTTTQVDISAVADAASECVYSTRAGLAWEDQSAMTTSDDLTHTASVDVVPGGIYRYCVTCRDASSLKAIPTHCTKFAIESWY